MVVSWWSYSTPLWYGRWVEGRRPDVTIIDDRDILDDGYGDGRGAIDTSSASGRSTSSAWRAICGTQQRYVLERVASIPSPGDAIVSSGAAKRQAVRSGIGLARA